MATPSFVVTVNGQRLEKVLDAEHRAEINSANTEAQKAMSFLVARSRSTSTARTRNHSGARSGRGRIIFSAVAKA